ncbi:hypothetical protein FH609_024740 [Streptomyces sp. 3MP-14]|uniref:Uncharacterized protein n=1 Tax=Streptomyces mimosae TaxID=2586635 RepID=A0A5N6A1Q3_9ACTN|nr:MULTISPECIES: hypothetical protein [Streptomyces]KAB8162172.1 hypothetical protein FH607_021995 [Streptomyces mimosae]KAB8173930.1 hypothetical protein FH609_024740 [Streptomyces sp. 3MP-14]
MRIPFSDAGLPGQLHVKIAATVDPDALGAGPGAADLPHCTAVVEYPGRGYHGFFGWIQAVRSTDDASGGKEFAMDPLASLGELPHPFAFAGHRPTLFDAPARSPRVDMEWVAHAFLCRGPQRPTFTARALAGFSWGFVVRDERVTLAEPRQLTAEDWNALLPLLRDTYPRWEFPPGFPASAAGGDRPGGP